MAKKYHINDKGEAKICRAARKCPIGGEHFENIEDANKYIEKKYEQENSVFSSHSINKKLQPRISKNKDAEKMREVIYVRKRLSLPDITLEERVKHMESLRKMLNEKEFYSIENTPVEDVLTKRIDSLAKKIDKKKLDNLLDKAIIKQVYLNDPNNDFEKKYPVGTILSYNGDIYTVVENNSIAGSRSLSAMNSRYETLVLFETTDDSNIKISFKPEIMNQEIKKFRENYARNSMFTIQTQDGHIKNRVKVIDNDGVNITIRNLDTNEITTDSMESFKNNNIIHEVLYRAPYKSPSDIAKEAKATFTKNSEFQLYDDKGNTYRAKVVRNSNNTITFDDVESGERHYIVTKDLVNGEYTYVNLTEQKKREEEEQAKKNDPNYYDYNSFPEIRNITPPKFQKISSVTDELKMDDYIRITDSHGYVVADSARITYNDGVEVYYSTNNYGISPISNEALEINHWTVEKI